MSQRPIARSRDLLRLRNEGYSLEIRGGLLLVKSVPYVDSNRAIRRDGTLIVQLNLSGDTTNAPSTHVAYWSGDHPCHSDGSRIAAFQHPSPPQDMGHGVRADFTFSAKAEYRDHHHQVATYVGRIVGEACKIAPEATACIFRPIPSDEDSVFKYVDTASSRVGIDAVNERTVGKRIGIVGAGGSGAYVLDFVAKTWVAEIHLFDGDVFSQHNAFRAPGAPTLEQLEARPQKVAYLKAIYENMRNGIVAHDGYLEGNSLALLDGLDFVFLCLDHGPVKRLIVERLIANGMPFVEVGMGVVLSNGQLSGIVRTVTSTPETRAEAGPHVSYAAEDGVANDYATKIQIAELNAINAAIAVVQWKKLLGIYQDTRGQFYTGYSIPSGEIISEGKK
jgi:hypothetical protein